MTLCPWSHFTGESTETQRGKLTRWDGVRGDGNPGMAPAALGLRRSQVKWWEWELEAHGAQ